MFALSYEFILKFSEQLSEYDRIYHKFDTIRCCTVHTQQTPKKMKRAKIECVNAKSILKSVVENMIIISVRYGTLDSSVRARTNGCGGLLAHQKEKRVMNS